MVRPPGEGGMWVRIPPAELVYSEVHFLKMFSGIWEDTEKSRYQGSTP